MKGNRRCNHATEEEAMNKANNQIENRKDGWVYADMKKFGWGLPPKNRKCRTFGYSMGKEYRKEVRRLLKKVRHSLLFRIPLSEDDIKSVWFHDPHLYFRALVEAVRINKKNDND